MKVEIIENKGLELIGINNYTSVYNEWLPQHPEYKAVMAVNVEWYTMGDFNSPDYKCGVMIPVECD